MNWSVWEPVPVHFHCYVTYNEINEWIAGSNPAINEKQGCLIQSSKGVLMAKNQTIGTCLKRVGGWTWLFTNTGY